MPQTGALGILLCLTLAMASGCIGTDGAAPARSSPDGHGITFTAQCPTPPIHSALRCEGEHLELRGPLELVPSEVPSKYGLLIMGVQTDLTIRDLTIRGFEVGIQIEGPLCSCQITIENVTILGEGESEKAAMGLYLRSSGEESPRLDLRDARFVADTPLQVISAGKVGIDRSSFAATKTGASIVGATAISLHNVEVNADALALEIIGADTVVVSDSVFASGGVAATLKVDESIHWTRSQATAATAGADLRAPNVLVDHGVFQVEGQEPAAFPSGCPSAALCIQLGSGSVHHTALEAPNAYGIWAPRNGLVNATDNWWGHPLGPTLDPADTGQPVLGARVTAGVIHTPWLTSPP